MGFVTPPHTPAASHTPSNRRGAKRSVTSCFPEARTDGDRTPQKQQQTQKNSQRKSCQAKSFCSGSERTIAQVGHRGPGQGGGVVEWGWVGVEGRGVSLAGFPVRSHHLIFIDVAQPHYSLSLTEKSMPDSALSAPGLLQSDPMSLARHAPRQPVALGPSTEPVYHILRSRTAAVTGYARSLRRLSANRQVSVGVQMAYVCNRQLLKVKLYQAVCFNAVQSSGAV